MRDETSRWFRNHGVRPPRQATESAGDWSCSALLSNRSVHRRSAMSAGTRAPQASRLDPGVRCTPLAPLRAAVAVALAPLATGAAGTLVPNAALVTVAALRRAHLRIQRRPPDSIERAALQMLRTTAARSDQPDADGFSACALPFGTRAIRHIASILAVGQRSCWAGVLGKLLLQPVHF